MQMLMMSRAFERNGLKYSAYSISLLLHGMLFVGYGGSVAPSAPQQISTVTRMSFLTPSKQDITPVEKRAEPEKMEEAVKDDTLAKKELPAREESKPKPVKKSVPTPEKATAQASNSTETVQLNDGVIARETERYLSDVMAHIEQFKWYPKAAKRRGIEGEVAVSFVLMPDGSTKNLTVENGQPVLLTAARKAVEKANPMPKPPASIHCPMPCEFRMRFNLKDG